MFLMLLQAEIERANDGAGVIHCNRHFRNHAGRKKTHARNWRRGGS